MTTIRMPLLPIASGHKKTRSQPACRTREEQPPWHRRAETILLTGGSGFLGREIIPRLVRMGRTEAIYLLMRGEDDAEVSRRFHQLVDSLRRRWPDLEYSCLHAIRGDVALPGLGLGRADSRALAGSVTRIVHAAALTNLNATLAEARRANLGGAREILQLAAWCPRLVSISWISTAFVAGNRAGRIMEEELQNNQGFRNAYEQSKYEAELMVRSAAARLPVTVFRPSIIVGDSRDGYTCNFASIYWPLRLVARGVLRRVPGDPQTLLDLVPVNYVADAIVELMQNEDAVGRCYHLVAGQSGAITARELLEHAIRRFDRGGKPLRFEPPCPGKGFGLHAFFTYLQGCKVFVDSAARAALRPIGLRCPRVRDYLDNLFDFCECTDWGEQNDAGPALRPGPAMQTPKGAAVC